MPSGEVPIILNGATELLALSKRMKSATPAFRKEFYAGLNRAAKPMKEAVQAEARTSLPRGGGRGRRRTRLVDTGETLTNQVSGRTHKIKQRQKMKSMKAPSSVADRVAGASYTIRAKGGKNPTIVLRAAPKKGKSIDLAALDKGRLRHPLFGNKRHWYTQPVTPGWFSRPVDKQVDNVRRELLKAIDDAKHTLDL